MSSCAAVVGLEVHVQLDTETKMFCGCPNRFGAPPNTLVCPICLGYPGTLPNPNRRAAEIAASLALALGCRVHERSLFERKSYFYPDLPKGYQITQQRFPLATGGRLPLAAGAGLGLRRLHLEEDAGKLVHDPGGAVTLVDHNRCGVPLVEIVSEPELASGAEAGEALRQLHRLLLYTGASPASLEEGSLRCDANVSLARGAEPPGEQVEIKNLNSFRHLRHAVEAEVERQRRVVAGGGVVERETRGFDEGRGVTVPLRGKEASRDYRWFPDPDLPPLEVSAALLDRLRAELPEPPWRRRERLEADLGLSPEAAEVLTGRRELADYFEAAAAGGDPVAVAHWVRTEVLARAHRGRPAPAQALPPRRLARLVALVAEGVLSAAAGKRVLDRLWGRDEEADDAVARLGLARVDDGDRIAAWAGEVLAAGPALVERYHRGHRPLLGYFVGRVMELSGGRADPVRARAELARLLAREPVTP
jgi:aspartyl-tRNA(Asn)/glutamyl-tRNA(Gln) amidotransferase subunit B